MDDGGSRLRGEGLDAVHESHAANHLRQIRTAIEASSAILGGQGQLEHHREIYVPTRIENFPFLFCSSRLSRHEWRLRPKGPLENVRDSVWPDRLRPEGYAVAGKIWQPAFVPMHIRTAAWQATLGHKIGQRFVADLGAGKGGRL